MSNWFLVMVATQAYIGPLPEASCNMAAANLRASGGGMCAGRLKLCLCGRRPGSFTICPIFEFPKVMRK